MSEEHNRCESYWLNGNLSFLGRNFKRCASVINYKRSKLVIQAEIYCQALSSRQRQRMFYGRTNGVHMLSTAQTNCAYYF